MLTVYIVDDSQMMRERLTESVADIAGMEIVGQSGDAYDALDGIGKSQPDIVILDIRLPGRSGIDLMKEIKRNSLPPIVIMISNHLYPQYRQASLSAGADYFFSKINEFEMIQQTLNRIGRDRRIKIQHAHRN